MRVRKSPYFAPTFFFALRMPNPCPANSSPCTSSMLTSMSISLEQPKRASKELMSIHALRMSMENSATRFPF